MLTDDQIARIAERVFVLLNKQAAGPPPQATESTGLQDLPVGIFATIDSAVQAAAEAQRCFIELTLAKRGE